MIRIVTAEAARRIDRDAISVRGVSGAGLMAAAGKAVARAAAELCEAKKIGQVQIFCGKGNNGGDGFVAALELTRLGTLQVDVLCFADENDLQGDARSHFDALREAAIVPHMIRDAAEVPALLRENACWIDAIFGSGMDRPVTGFYSHVMQALHDRHTVQPVIAVDIPSGIDGTGGILRGPALKADITLCMGFYKTGNFLLEGKAYCGELRLVELPYPEVSFEQAVPDIRLCDHDTAAARLKPIPLTGHKYKMGQVLCLGGSAAMPGAVTLASQAALKSGSGMLRAYVPGQVKPFLLNHLPEAVADAGENAEMLVTRDLPRIRGLLSKSAAVLIGPGLGRAPESGRLVRMLLQEIRLPLVLDADALFHVTAAQIKSAAAPAIITPHAGEFAGLIKKEIPAVMEASVELAVKFAIETGAIVHLKGSTSLTALPSGAVYLHLTGAPGMATAGSGDLLAGLIASFLAQGHSPEDAVLIGATYHGLSGQAAAAALGNRSMIASDMLTYLPLVLKDDEVLA
ncbi:MAG: NAD(P)H-hydrate dehydratase [Candidatus Marinimicrobia bacterium]|nr:NAD(P)H-hydrate dehydratase [Candidatus Neomarinimicrobiota bacterium]